MKTPPFGEYFVMFSNHQTSKSKVCSFLVTMGVFPNASGERKVQKGTEVFRANPRKEFSERLMVLNVRPTWLPY